MLNFAASTSLIFVMTSQLWLTIWSAMASGAQGVDAGGNRPDVDIVYIFNAGHGLYHGADPGDLDVRRNGFQQDIRRIPDDAHRAPKITKPITTARMGSAINPVK